MCRYQWMMHSRFWMRAGLSRNLRGLKTLRGGILVDAPSCKGWTACRWHTYESGIALPARTEEASSTHDGLSVKPRGIVMLHWLEQPLDAAAPKNLLIRCQCKFRMLLHEAINVMVEFPHCLPMAHAGKANGIVRCPKAIMAYDSFAIAVGWIEPGDELINASVRIVSRKMLLRN